ncbi:MAG: ATP-binding protein, partial [Clostridia bacterium]|nr:ATP-binding protein [Clostridia bacterium]
MSYSKNIYLLAQGNIEKRRKDAEESLEERRAQAYAKIPKLVEIQSRIAILGAQAVTAISKGADGPAYIAKLAEESLAAQQERKQLLKAAGLPEDYLEPHYTCKICSDTGIVDDGICTCQREMLISTAKDEIEKFAPLRRSTFDSYSLKYYPEETDVSGVSPKKRMGEIAQFCKDYALDFSLNSPSLFMHGATGLGKTHLSLAIANEAIERGYGVIYGSAPNLFGALER